MSRKRKAPKKIPIVDPKYKSVIIPKPNQFYNVRW